MARTDAPGSAVRRRAERLPSPGPAVPPAPGGTERRAATVPGALLLAAAAALALAGPTAAQEAGADTAGMLQGTHQEEAEEQEEHAGHGLKQEAVPLQDLPDRPDLLLEIGEDYLSPGPLSDGLELPTGAVWRPALWVYGTFRSGIQSFETGAPPGTPSATNSEWANRLDLVANLRLTGTERLVVSYRPFGLGGGLGHEFGDDPGDDGWNADLREELQSFFFEGDVGEIFPNLDDDETAALDYGFSVGRQRIRFQDGLIVDDDLDAVGLTRNSLRPSGFSNLRITGLYAWNQVHRRNVEDESAQLVGLFNQADFPGTTVSLDVAYTFSDAAGGRGAYAAASATQRLWIGDRIFNTTFRLAGSLPTDEPAPAAATPLDVGEGALLLTEVSWTPHGEYGLWYVNGFWAAGEYTPAARRVGGPLGGVGILFAAPGLGRFGSPLSPVADDAAGGAIGRQLLFDGGRRQIVLEAAGRAETDAAGGGSVAAGVRFQQAVGRRLVIRVDGFAVAREEGDPPLGIRAETLVKF